MKVPKDNPLSLENEVRELRSDLIKRIIDILLSTVSLLIFAPIFLLIAFAIKLDSPGPVLFVDRRLGRRGKIFRCFKFRTMFIDGDKRLKECLEQNSSSLHEWRSYAKLKSFDPRITKVGQFLRRYSLDELPQIFNVLKGDMHLVGPRPYLLRERSQMGEYADKILKIRPGITGFWQVSGRNEIPFEERLKMESYYAENNGLRTDIILLVKTVKAVLEGRGAY